MASHCPITGERVDLLRSGQGVCSPMLSVREHPTDCRGTPDCRQMSVLSGLNDASLFANQHRQEVVLETLAFRY